MSDQFLPIHPMTMRIDTEPAFDLFIGCDNGDHVPFHAAETPYTHEVHGRVFNETINNLYIRAEDTAAYEQYLENVFATVIRDPFIDGRIRAELAHRLLVRLAGEVFAKPVAERADRYKAVIDDVTAYILDDSEAIPNLIAATRSSFHDADHLVNVGIYGMGLARELLDPARDNMAEVAAGFFLHDIGRYNIPRSILEKKGPLTAEEWLVVKRHPQTGFEQLLTFGRVPEESRNIILQHHERHDGNGYPLGLTGDNIHTYSKICTIADAFDALTSHRPYRAAHSSFDALKIMHEEMRHEFDPDFFSRFVMLFRSDKKMTIDRSQRAT